MIERKPTMPSPQPELDLWALWPDDYMCPIGEVETELTWRSDDYMLVVVTEYDEAGLPDKFHRYVP